MKTKLFFIPIALFACAFCFANEEVQEERSSSHEKTSFTYVTLGASAISANESLNPIPAITIGHRFERERSAIDISYGATYGETTKERHTAWSYTLPRILHIGYLQPKSDSSFYYGLGASFGGIRDTLQKKHFTGIFGNAALGLEMSRSSRIRTMLQLDMSQPVLGIKKTDISFLPTVQLSYGIGF